MRSCIDKLIEMFTKRKSEAWVGTSLKLKPVVIDRRCSIFRNFKIMYALKILFCFLKVALATTKIYWSSASIGPFWRASEIVSGQPLTMLLDLSVATDSIIKMLTEQETLFLMSLFWSEGNTHWSFKVVWSCQITLTLRKTKPIKNKKRK